MTLTASYTEGNYAADFLVSEANGTRARSAITVASGQNLGAGAVLGSISRVQAAAPIPAIVGTGTGLMSLLRFGPDVQVGSYVITLLATSATAAFSVVAPDGTVLPNGAVATPYSSSHLSFTIANGGTMTIADKYTVVVTAGGTPVIVGTGSGAMSGVTLGKNAKLGTYKVRVTSTAATAILQVTDPDGQAMADGKIAVAYLSDQINFTVADGGTMTINDYYNIIVANGSGYVSAYAPTTVDGTQKAVGVLYAPVDATSAIATGTMIARSAEVVSAKLVWGATVTASQKANAINQLAALGIIAR